MAGEVFDQLVTLLTDAKANFRVIEHAHEGKSEAISAIRGNRPDQAAKAMVLDVRGGGGGKRHVLAILPGSRKLDFAAVAEIRARIVQARNRGAAVLLVSEDLDEILQLSDRIVVMFDGRLALQTEAATADVGAIGRAMAGH